MAPKAKNVVGSKQSRKGEASGSKIKELAQKFGKKVVQRYRLTWFDCHREAKYIGDEYVDSFYANWLTKTKYKTVPIRGRDVKFSTRILNELLGTLNYDADDFNMLKEKPLYKDIRHTLCGVELTARWGCSKYTERHSTLHFANFNLITRVWLKIVCSILLPAKYLTEVTRDRVVLVYMLMKGMPINVGVVLRQNMMKFRNNLCWRFCYGGLITRFLRTQGIEDEACDLTIAFLRIGGRPVIDAEMETNEERYPLTESAAFLCRTGPAFLETLDDDEATADEAMDDKEDDVVDEEANALMVFDHEKRTLGRQKILMAKIEDEDDLYSTFPKRYARLYKKASDMIEKYDIDVGIIIFFPH
ncbi:hypothetical protein H5410_044679 [Solanum commersonii]|uniref:MADS-box domain-containing protein n=1 Tax=Solanum commersonii TaxID=4109 RepID=A0A9J5X9P0_SOLCO|nr:hypothetical protein H5410_044679 [Solanum commersonii]